MITVAVKFPKHIIILYVQVTDHTDLSWPFLKLQGARTAYMWAASIENVISLVMRFHVFWNRSVNQG